MQKPTTPEQHAQAKLLHSRGYSCRKIGVELGISHSTAHNIVSNGAIRRKSKPNPQELRFAPGAVVNAESAKVTTHRFTPYPNSPVCNGTMTAIYKGEDLARMGR